MKLIPVVGLAALISASAGSAALAQGARYPNENPNVEAYRDYQAQRDAYGDQVDAYARQRDDYAEQRDAYEQNAVDYRAERRAYERRLRAYEWAREAYDARYGPGAYEHYYRAPMAPD